MTHHWTTGPGAHVLRTAAVLALLALVLPDRFSGAQTSEIVVGQPTVRLAAVACAWSCPAICPCVTASPRSGRRAFRLHIALETTLKKAFRC